MRIANAVATPKPRVCRLDQGLGTAWNSVPHVFVPNVPGNRRVQVGISEGDVHSQHHLSSNLDFRAL